MTQDREAQDQRIRERAYQLWEREGRRHGEPEDHWHRARREIEQDDERSGSPQDQLAADDRPGLRDPAEASAALPAAPEDEPAPALSATLEEAPGEPATARPSPKPKAARPAVPKPAKAAAPKAPAAKPAAPKPAAKPRKNPVG
jgi:hypothetical protein